MAKRLNGGVLPPQYESEPESHHGTSVEIDLATYHDEPDAVPAFGTNGHRRAAVETQAYSPPVALAVGPVSFLDTDVFELKVYKQSGGLKLVAAVELVSPSNKDRPSSRQAFNSKVTAYLQRGVSVVTIDTVTERAANLHEELVQQLRLADGFAWQSPTGLSAVSYRVVRVGEENRLEMFPFALTVGGVLPTIPLWLNPVLAVPLELEPTYEETCDALRIT